MAEKDEIPVCTLFQDGGDSTNVNDLFSKGNNASLDHEKKAKESSNLSQQQEPGVCNIFQTNSPEVDMFSSLAIVSENENLSHVDNVNYPNYLNPPSIENPNDVVPMFTEENLAATQTLILETNSEETTDRHIADTTMASILIDDSFENISNVSFDQPEDEPEPTTKSDSDTSIDKKQKTESSEIDDNLLSKEETVCSSTTEKLDVDNLETSPETFFLDGETSKAPPASGLFSNFQNTSPFDHIRKPSEDAFTSALTSSEADRRRDAWLPSESTSAVLSAVFTTQKRIKLEANHLTRPGLATSESLGDPIKSVLVRHGGTEAANKRQRKTAQSVSQNKTGLLELVNGGDFRAAVDLCGRILTDFGQGFGQATQPSENSHLSLQWWHARLTLLIRLKLYELAETEINQFHDFDTADLYFGFYPDLYPGRKGSMVPFSMRVLHAQFPMYLNKPNEALERLYTLQNTSNKILKNLESGKTEDGSIAELKPDDREASITLWNDRSKTLLFCIGNVLLQTREYEAAIKTYELILEKSEGDAVYLQSGIGRALLQLGNIKSAQHRFAKAEQAAKEDPNYKLQLIMNRAFLYLGTSNWKEALTQFNEVLKLNPQHLEALNNKSVCLLYLCRLKDAISSLETAVWMQNNDSKDFLQNQLPLEGALSNLVTLYELESSRFMTKKQTLLHHIAGISGDGFDVTCLKM